MPPTAPSSVGATPDPGRSSPITHETTPASCPTSPSSTERGPGVGFIRPDEADAFPCSPDRKRPFHPIFTVSKRLLTVFWVKNDEQTIQASCPTSPSSTERGSPSPSK